MPAGTPVEGTGGAHRAGLAKGVIFAILAELEMRQGERPLHGDIMVPLLRFIAVALLAPSLATVMTAGAAAEPLDKDACAELQQKQKTLLTPAMQTALDRGPDWVKDHLNDQDIEKVREFLEVEEMIKFRCRSGVPKPSPPAPPPSPVSAEGVPVPDRNPNRPATASVDAKPSQTVADSDKTAPSKAKATR
jgi:hypothetical protein